MRASIIIATHNECETLVNTVRACIEGSARVDCEIVVGDDASTDDSVAEVDRLFCAVRIVRHDERRGVSPTRHTAARVARGETLLFFDGHCNPERGAIERLVEDVELARGDAVITPTISALDTARWENAPEQSGHGYKLELESFDCGWMPLGHLRQVREGGRTFYESPAMVGCAAAMSRQLYESLWGFDPGMRNWGVEDLDFSLKCWLSGHRILHDPEAVVGHRFRTGFDNYDARIDDFLVNQLRMAWKNFTPGAWEQWIEHARQRHARVLTEYPEGLWARVWAMFLENRGSADQERAHLSASRVRDEFWFAERFGLNWPRLAAFPSETVAAEPQSPEAAGGGDNSGPGPVAEPEATIARDDAGSASKAAETSPRRAVLSPSPSPGVEFRLAPSPAP